MVRSGLARSREAPWAFVGGAASAAGDPRPPGPTGAMGLCPVRGLGARRSAGDGAGVVAAFEGWASGLFWLWFASGCDRVAFTHAVGARGLTGAPGPIRSFSQDAESLVVGSRLFELLAVTGSPAARRFRRV